MWAVQGGNTLIDKSYSGHDTFWAHNVITKSLI